MSILAVLAIRRRAGLAAVPVCVGVDLAAGDDMTAVRRGNQVYVICSTPQATDSGLAKMIAAQEKHERKWMLEQFKIQQKLQAAQMTEQSILLGPVPFGVDPDIAERARAAVADTRSIQERARDWRSDHWKTRL